MKPEQLGRYNLSAMSWKCRLRLLTPGLQKEPNTNLPLVKVACGNTVKIGDFVEIFSYAGVPIENETPVETYGTVLAPLDPTWCKNTSYLYPVVEVARIVGDGKYYSSGYGIGIVWPGKRLEPEFWDSSLCRKPINQFFRRGQVVETAFGSEDYSTFWYLNRERFYDKCIIVDRVCNSALFLSGVGYTVRMNSNLDMVLGPHDSMLFRPFLPSGEMLFRPPPL